MSEGREAIVLTLNAMSGDVRSLREKVRQSVEIYGAEVMGEEAAAAASLAQKGREETESEEAVQSRVWESHKGSV